MYIFCNSLEVDNPENYLQLTKQVNFFFLFLVLPLSNVMENTVYKGSLIKIRAWELKGASVSQPASTELPSFIIVIVLKVLLQHSTSKHRMKYRWYSDSLFTIATEKMQTMNYGVDHILVYQRRKKTGTMLSQVLPILSLSFQPRDKRIRWWNRKRKWSRDVDKERHKQT